MIFAGKQQDSTMNHIKQTYFTWINNESNRSSIYHAQVGAALLVKSLELGDIAAVLSQCPDPPPEISVLKREGFGGMASIDILRYYGILLGISLGISLGIYSVFIGSLSCCCNRVHFSLPRVIWPWHAMSTENRPLSMAGGTCHRRTEVGEAWRSPLQQSFRDELNMLNIQDRTRSNSW